MSRGYPRARHQPDDEWPTAHVALTARFREAFRALGEFFNELIGPADRSAGSFLWLDPLKEAIQFFGVSPELSSGLVSAEMTKKAAKKFTRHVAAVLASLEPAGTSDLFEVVRRVAYSTPDYDPQEAHEGAVALLNLEPFLPGTAHDRSGGSLEFIPHWWMSTLESGPRELRPLTRFQDALDLAAIFHFEIENTRLDDRLATFNTAPPRAVVKVADYADHPGLLTRTNARMYVAEYFQVLGPKPLTLNTDWAFSSLQGVDEYFVPMRGLAQWRAAFEYKVLRLGTNPDTECQVEQRLKELNQPTRSALEELFTRALINTFADVLRNATAGDDLRYRAFASLWWAHEIRFGARVGRDLTWVQRLEWCPQSRQLVVRSAEPSMSPDDDLAKTNSFGRTHTNWLSIETGPAAARRSIRLDLARLRELPERRRWFADHWGFEVVDFSCYLVDDEAQANDLHRWADILGDELVQVRSGIYAAELLQAREIRVAAAEAQYSTALFAFGHHVGKLFQESGLAEFEPTKYERQDHSEVRFLTSMKTRLLLAWSVGEMIAPLRFAGRGYPARWFPKMEQPIIAQQVTANLRKVCQYYLSGLSDRLPQEWAIEWSDAYSHTHRQTIGELIAADHLWLPHLPPFAGGNPQQSATSALTLGLAEHLRNLRHNWLDNIDNLEQGYLHGAFKSAARIRVETEIAQERCQVEIEAISCYREGGTIESRSIAEIQELERTALAIDDQAVVETQQPVFIDKKGRFRRIRSRWAYNYGLVRKAPETERP